MQVKHQRIGIGSIIADRRMDSEVSVHAIYDERICLRFGRDSAAIGSK
jgi:hypothetical protein